MFPLMFTHIYMQFLPTNLICDKFSRVGDQLEVVDKNRICQLRVATVSRIVGRRLQVEYFDSVGDGGTHVLIS